MKERIDEMARSKNAKERKKAISILLSLKKEEAVEKVKSWIESEEPLMRQTAIMALGELLKQGERLELLLEKALRDESWLVREAIARALRGTRRKKIAQELLMELARDPSPGVNRSTGDTLAEFIGEGIISQSNLEKLASSKTEGERRTAAFAMRRIYNRGWKIFGESALDILRKWVSESPEKRWTVIYACKLIGKREPLAKEIIMRINDVRVSKLKEKAIREIDHG